MKGRVLGLNEAASSFLGGIPSGERSISQQEVYRFVRWFGWERPFSSLKAPEVAKYAEQLSRSDRDYVKKLELIRTFLVHARKEGWTEIGLAGHLKVRKGRAPTKAARQGLAEAVPLTLQGYAKLEAELTVLKNKRPEIIDEVRKAAADKDFRENAPLEAARQQQGQLEGRIRELEGALKSATIIEKEKDSGPKVGIGDNIILKDLSTGEELRYMLVGPREVDPSRGKISGVSPVGKAVTGRSQGEIVEITVPAGKLRYEIRGIER